VDKRTKDERTSRRIRLGALIAALVLLPISPAKACSCAWGDAREQLANAQAAFIGKMVTVREATTPEPGAPISSGREVIYTFEVEEDFKVDLGDHVEIHSAADGASCGLEVSPGQSEGFFLREHKGVWWSSLCQQVPPDELRAAAAPLPAPDGVNPVRFLAGGAFGDGRLVALDKRGRTLAYGYGHRATGLVAVCPGSERSVEISYGDQWPRAERARLSVRRLSDFKVKRQVVLPFDYSWRNRRLDPQDLVCRDRAARDIVVAASRDVHGHKSRIARVTPSGIRTIHQGSARMMHLTNDRAFLVSNKARTRIRIVNLNSGRVRALPALPSPVAAMALAPDRPLLGVLSTAYQRPTHLYLVRLRSGAHTQTRIESGGEYFSGELRWQSDDRLVLLPSGGSNDGVITFDRSLKRLGSLRWHAAGGVVWNGRAYGVDWSGRFHEAPLPGGKAKVIRQLVSRSLTELVVVPGDTAVAFEPRPSPSPSP
jgi:hypothetical protein